MSEPVAALPLAGRCAIVTAAGGPMGAGIAERLCEVGAKVFLNDISGRRLEEQRARLSGRGFVVHALRGDVTVRAEAEALFTAARQEFTRIHILVNVVGGYRGEMYQSVTDIPEDRFDFVFRLNLKGTYHLTQLAGRHMVDAGGGRIINISSISKDGAAGQSDYAAAKAGVVGYTRTCAMELAPTVTVNAIAPGVIQTSTMDRMDESILTAYRERIPLQRFGTPRDVGGAVAFLASDDAGYITGETIHVSGGFFSWL